MSLSRRILAALPVMAAAAAHAQTGSPNPTPYLMADRASEVALARSSAPVAVSEAASVLVLTRDGYIEAAKGTNGFTCLVVRAFGGSLTDLASWTNVKVRAPHCLNPAATRTVLPEMKKRAALVMSGMAFADVVKEIRRAHAAKAFPATEDGALAYMMSPRQYLGDDNPHWMPHLMFYFGGGRKGPEWGAAALPSGMSAPVIDGGFDELSNTTVVMIPVPKWSDGTPFTQH
jgi:hypothetical protein